jgi:hypothetical protein
MTDKKGKNKKKKGRTEQERREQDNFRDVGILLVKRLTNSGARPYTNPASALA